jgi:lipopolysaccharide transport system ATP-binding protein
MPEILINAEKLSKKYNLRPNVGLGWRKNQRVLVDDLANIARQIRDRSNQPRKIAFWALKDVSFECEEGEVIGIIGRNGAGKSTLLKILSRVTQPTSGRAVINGRIGSLLEVGTGFHSELTGRENIFISGAIIGMSRAEIKRKFDEIVEFSGVRDFLDTPVKRFSSGMEVRLAFSVAAHLHPQVLLVDEVLSIGDIEFQQKSLQKIKEVASSGGVVLFVSHNMTSITGFCNQAIVLDHGKVVFPKGDVRKAVQHYHSLQTSGYSDTADRMQRSKDSPVRLKTLRLTDEYDHPTDLLTSGAPINFIVEFQADSQEYLVDSRCVLQISSAKGEVIASMKSDIPLVMLQNGDGSQSITCHVDKIPLTPGIVHISASIEHKGQVLDYLEDAYVGSVDVGGRIVNRPNEKPEGLIVLEGKWH